MIYRYSVECCRGGPLTSVFRGSQAVPVTALLDAIIRNTFIIKVYSAFALYPLQANGSEVTEYFLIISLVATVLS